jgi:acyl-CoA hydrolase
MLMKLVDTAGAIAAHRDGRRRVVTVAMDSMQFHAPVHVGELPIVTARVMAVWSTSVETVVTVEAENPIRGERRHTCAAFLVYVALDENGRSAPLPPLDPSDEADGEMARAADQRRRHRLAERGGRA